MNEHWMSQQVREDWQKARRRAFWGGLLDAIQRRPSELLPLEAVKTRLNVRGSHYRGLQQVPLAQIIGSEGRYADFDRRFLPRQDQTKGRWQSIDLARYRDMPLPAVELYKIGEVYFVKDGNHRVSVGRQLGQHDIDAFVTEYVVDVPLDPSVSMRDMLLKEEYSDFLEWTNLAQFRPQQRIELSALGGYLELVQHINTHRYYLALERGGEVALDEAVQSWYDTVYMPVIEVIRTNKVLQFFPGRTDADLYLWIMSHRNELRELSGEDPGAEAATLDYASQFGRRNWLEAVASTLQTVREATKSVLETSTPPALELLDFVAWSQIDHICPNADVRLSDAQDYDRLRQHILDHQYYLGKEWQRDVGLHEAMTHWCETLYTPILHEIERQRAVSAFPGHTNTDLFLWITEHRYFREREGIKLTIPDAVREFVTLYSADHADKKGSLARLVERARRLVRAIERVVEG